MLFAFGVCSLITMNSGRDPRGQEQLSRLRRTQNLGRGADSNAVVRVQQSPVHRFLIFVIKFQPEIWLSECAFFLETTPRMIFSPRTTQDPPQRVGSLITRAVRSNYEPFVSTPMPAWDGTRARHTKPTRSCSVRDEKETAIQVRRYKRIHQRVDQ